MKIYGYELAIADTEDVVPKELAEVTLVARADELRKIAQFLLGTAENMDRMGGTYDHEHLSDVDRDFESSPHFVVAKP